MIEIIPSEFPNCTPNGCISTVIDLEFRVYDRKDDCCFVSVDNHPDTLCYFTIKNPSGKQLTFLAIDKCLIPEDDDEKKCDCAVFDNKTFNFIEIKTASSGQRSKRRIKAFEQLKHTIGLFKSKMDFNNFDVYAMICIGCKAVYPRSTASHMGRRMEMSLLHKAKLVEGNLISFD
jgi:hypothetical protein